MIRLKPADFIVKWHKKPCDFCLSDRHSNKLWQFTGIEPEEVKKYAEWMSLGHELGEDPSLFICEVCYKVARQRLWGRRFHAYRSQTTGGFTT